MNNGDKPYVLIVDDRVENLMSFEALLEGSGCSIVKANSGQEALKEALKRDFALILLDVQMPHMDGFETAELLRCSSRTKHIPIIFISAISKERYHVFRGYESGAVDYLMKPVDSHILRSKVKIFLKLAAQKSKLMESNIELARISELKSRFISSVTHELRTPLAVISELISLVSDGTAGPLNVEQKNHLDSALRNCRRLGSLIDDLLDMSKIESGKLQIRKSRVNLLNLLEQLIEDFTPKCGNKSQELKFEYSRKPGDVFCDTQRTSQIVINLLENAHKFTPSGGSISIKTDSDDEMMRIHVEDSGIGIDPEDVNSIFDKFTQLESDKNDNIKGTGLGLSIARELARAQRGDIQVQSERGRGSRFTVTIPLYYHGIERDSEILDAAYSLKIDDDDVSLVALEISDLKEIERDNYPEITEDLKSILVKTFNDFEYRVIPAENSSYVFIIAQSDRKRAEQGMDDVCSQLNLKYSGSIKFQYGIARLSKPDPDLAFVRRWIQLTSDNLSPKAKIYRPEPTIEVM